MSWPIVVVETQHIFTNQQPTTCTLHTHTYTRFSYNPSAQHCHHKTPISLHPRQQSTRATHAAPGGHSSPSLLHDVTVVHTSDIAPGCCDVHTRVSVPLLNLTACNVGAVREASLNRAVRGPHPSDRFHRSRPCLQRQCSLDEHSRSNVCHSMHTYFHPTLLYHCVATPASSSVTPIAQRIHVHTPAHDAGGGGDTHTNTTAIHAFQTNTNTYTHALCARTHAYTHAVNKPFLHNNTQTHTPTHTQTRCGDAVVVGRSGP
jgi:hypothetical protein